MTPYFQHATCTLYQGDALATLRELPSESVHCCVTSPPYWGLRDYGNDAQLGLERTPDEYVARLVEVFAEVRRVLRADGTFWLVIGDSYASGKNGLKPKDLVGIPWRMAFALQADGWWLRSDVIWSKPNPMPESVTDRPTKAHEYVFLLTKSERYYYDGDGVREATVEPWGGKDKGVAPCSKDHHTQSQSAIRNGYGRMGNNPAGRNKRTVWTVATMPYPGAHFATYPPKLIEPCIMAGCPVGGTVIDPFAGSGTTLMVARNLGRKAVGIELSEEYCQLAIRRVGQGALVQEVA